MKIRTLIVSILGVLVVSNVSLTQVAETPEQEPQEMVYMGSDVPLPQTESSFVTQAATAPTPGVPRPQRLNPTPVATPTQVRPKPITKSLTMVTRVFELKYVSVVDVEVMLSNVFSIQKVYSDRRSNKLIVQAMEGQMKEVESLIEEMDISGSQLAKDQDVQNLVYRIYMFEIASGDEGMKPFSMILQVPSEASTTQLFDTARDGELQISGFCLSDERDGDGKGEILIHGKAASDMTLKRMVVDDIPESQIKELKWDDAETFTNEIAAAQYMQLPEQMQKHIAKFLGDEIRTVGYWFGNLSAPGEVQAPIGPWTLTLRLDTESDHMLELTVDVEMPGETHNFDRRLGRERNNEILSNSIRAKIGKPIIIGYNRDSYGTRKMGAMVIVPEVDMIKLEENK